MRLGTANRSGILLARVLSSVSHSLAHRSTRLLLALVALSATAFPPIDCYKNPSLRTPKRYQALQMSASTVSTSIRRPRVAVIGSGAAGLAAAKAFGRGAHACDVVVFEKDSYIGGVWRHEPKARDRPMYQGLRTNLPKEIMAFREYPWTNVPVDDGKSFVRHEQVLQYLQSYAEKYSLSQFIKTNTRVEQLTVLSDAQSAFSSKWPMIQIDTATTTTADGQDEQTKEKEESQLYDAVCICNGHYSLPAMPKLPGLHEYFTGRILHSIEYDDPSEFQGQSVLCIGGRASGSDLAREIAQHAKHVYLSDTVFEGSEPVSKFNVTWVPKTVGIAANGHVQFDRDCPVSSKVDCIIFCTGYDYHFPFINAKSNLELQVGGRRVAPLFEQLWYAHAPNVAFVGLSHSVLPFPFFEFQVQACERQWRCGGQDLPTAQQLVKAAKAAAMSGGEGKKFGRVPEDTHYLGSAQWDYCRRMAEYADAYDEKLSDYLAINKVS